MRPNQVRGIALALLWELPLSLDGARELLSAVATPLLGAVTSADSTFERWWLPHSVGALQCLRAWQVICPTAVSCASVPFAAGH